MAVKLGFWYATLISDDLNFDTEQFSFIPPKSPKDATIKLKDEINRLKKELNYLERSQPIEYLKSEEKRHISTLKSFCNLKLTNLKTAVEPI